MFIYSVTHVPTKNFYIGFHSGPIKDIQLDMDPMKVFLNQINGYNDAHVMRNVVKDLLVKIGDIQEARQTLANLAKHYESNPNFLGIRVHDEPVKNIEKPKEKPKESIAPTQKDLPKNL